MFVGDGIGKTIITGSKSVGGGSTTFKSATVAVVGDGFVARDITFRNTAGAANHQAVALRSGSDLSVFYKCSFEGYQDTLYVHSERQFYRECDIYGTVDFIFGNAAVMEWSGNFALKTLYYGEYMNTGPGSSTKNRVKWGGYRVITSASEASKFTVGNFIAGSSWLPATSVPFTSGL
ncbi:Pectinesterase [Psidium guajava]|nr:Pectinesterase [Psidium guajava]